MQDQLGPRYSTSKSATSKPRLMPLRSLKMTPFDRLRASICWRSISCRLLPTYEHRRGYDLRPLSALFCFTTHYLCKSTILPPLSYLPPRSGEPRQNFPATYCTEKLKWWSYHRVNIIAYILFYDVWAIYTHYRRADVNILNSINGRRVRKTNEQ